ncbi:hypothetical protein BDB00DRAFT_807484 [Zychaea mexicana]|uniref:uncharacterized protein n=1 Tax=Zychaea mexicana TaxID=64656 RepID=UPI0022FEF154|nr:uncharacterized protein BDB00DRAFT_807484 [Zychaea mexicana]KAI9496840.1 hypothetical protein BDB00DRAFT_807484 [Zychaea mexicana]
MIVCICSSTGGAMIAGLIGWIKWLLHHHHLGFWLLVGFFFSLLVFFYLFDFGTFTVTTAVYRKRAFHRVVVLVTRIVRRCHVHPLVARFAKAVSP